MLRRLKIICGLLATMSLATGCQFGYASFSGDLSGKSFVPENTVFAYTDQFTTREDPPKQTRRVSIVMTWASMDPSTDLLTNSKDSFARIQREFIDHDLLVVTISNTEGIRAGRTYSSNENLDFEILVSPQSTAANEVFALGGERSMDLTIDSVELDQGAAHVQGRLDLYVRRKPNEPDSVLAGRLQANFDAPLVKEAVAKKNLKALGNDIPALRRLKLF